MTNEFCRDARRNAAPYDRPEHRPVWMSDEQWSQLICWMYGEAIPTDPEILEGLHTDFEQDPFHSRQQTRMSRYLYSHILACLVGPRNFKKWSALVQQHGIDPAVLMDLGL